MLQRSLVRCARRPLGACFLRPQQRRTSAASSASSDTATPTTWRGIAAASSCAAVAFGASSMVGVASVPLAVLTGIGAGNALPAHVRRSFAPGLKFCSTTVLRAGIVCVGAKLSIVDLLDNVQHVPLIAASMSGVAGFTLLLASRLSLKRDLGALLAIGGSVCGVTAISVLAPSIRASDNDTALAIANVVLFGSAAMLALPHVVGALFDTPEQVGVFLGLAIHDTSQVVGAALTYSELVGDETALKIATATKLTRNVFLAAAVPLLTYFCVGATSTDGTRRAWSQYVPPFVLLFLGVVFAKGAVDLWLRNERPQRHELEAQWQRATKLIGGTASTVALTVALGAVGLSVNGAQLAAAFRTTLGRRAVAVSLSAAACAAALAWLVAQNVGKRMRNDEK